MRIKKQLSIDYLALWVTWKKVKRMVENAEDCSDVLGQLAAVRSALDNTGKVILKDYLSYCVVEAVMMGDVDAIDDICQASDKFVK